jgi:molybdenum cofactor cytidylyltransferase
MISAVVLAAGESKRMGRMKLTMPLGNTTVIGQVITNLLSSQVDEVIVVLGHELQEVKQTIGDKPVRFIINKEYKLGMSTSIITGLKELDSRSQAMIVVLGDQPFINNEIIDKLIEAYMNNNKGIVVPTYHGQKGHPVIFDMKYKAQLLSLTGDEGGRQLIADNNDDVLNVPVDSENIIKDIDTPDDYHASLESNESGRSEQTP